MTSLSQRNWQAFYYDGRSASRQDVVVSVLQQGLEIAAGDGTRYWWPYEEIRRTQGAFPGQHVRLERGEPISEALVVPDRKLLKAIGEISPGWEAQNRGVTARAGPRQYAAAAVGLLVLLPVLYVWVIPYIGDRVAVIIPVSWEEQLGEAAIGFLVKDGEQCEEEQVSLAMDHIVERLVAPAGDIPYTFTVHVSSGKAVNAFAAPGGHIVIFQGLIEKAETPEQLAGVLAHEIQHVLGRHSTRAILRELSIRAVLASMIGDMQGAAFALEAAGLLGTLHHRRRDEESADRQGMRLILQAHIDPRGMVDMFRHFEEMSSDMPEALEYFSTHPHTGDRIERLQKAAGRGTYVPSPLLEGSNWEQIRNACGDGTGEQAAGRGISLVRASL